MKITVSWGDGEEETVGDGCDVCYTETGELTFVTTSNAKCDCNTQACKLQWCDSLSGLHMARRLHRAGVLTGVDLQQSPTPERVAKLLEEEKRQLRHQMMMATNQLDMFTNQPALPGPGPDAEPGSLGLRNPERRMFVRTWLSYPYQGKLSNPAQTAGAELI